MGLAVIKRTSGEALTVAELREFVAECESAGISEDTIVISTAKLEFNFTGSRLIKIMAERED